MGKILGIDLGTTNSLAAVRQEGKSCLIPNSFGEYLTPSVVSFEADDTVYVGKTAKERLVSHPAQSFSVFKRFMGTDQRYEVNGKQYRPEELSAFVLRRLKEDAERYLGELIEEAVISVPAYFNDKARKATKDAGKLAGLKVERIINEPSAAALACRGLDEENDETFLVFDFGGGTLDVSLVDCFDNIIEIIAVSGDNHLGGSDFDKEIAVQFCREHELEFEHISSQRQRIILESASRAKCGLSEEKEVVMKVTDGEFEGQMEMSNKKLIEISMPLFERISVPVKRVLHDGKKNMLDISKVILVGGSCKMPSVQQYLRHMLGEYSLTVMNPDHMVALGVGTYAGIKERREDIKDLLLTDICPFSLGTGIFNAGNAKRTLMSTIIERNSVLPCSHRAHFQTASDYQKYVVIDVYQGEEYYADNNIHLGEVKVGVPLAPKGKETVTVDYTYDINGILIVDVEVDSTGEKKRQVITTGTDNMSSEEIKKRVEQLEKMKLSPADQEENQMLFAWGERLYAQTTGALKNEIGERLNFFQQLLHVEQNPYKVKKWKSGIEEFLRKAENYLDDSGIDWNPADIDSWYEEGDQDDERQEEDRRWYDGHLTH